MTREKRYRRLLALYPRDHRERHGEEMLGVLLDGNGGWRDGLDVAGGAIALHTRRLFGLDGGVRLRDVMAVVSLLGPIVMLAGAATDLHEIAWWIRAGDLADMRFEQVADAPVWAAWSVVAVLVLFGQRRAAAVSAWTAVVVHLLFMSMLKGYASTYQNAGWLLLGVFTAISLRWSAGPVRGREMVGRRGILVAFAGAAGSGLLLALSPRLILFPAQVWFLGPLLVYGALALGCHLACRPAADRRTGRRAAFVLALPAVAYVLEDVLVAIVGPPMYWIPLVTNLVFYGLPILMVLAGNGILRPIRKSLPS
ncbi:hypothetical protein [Kutzneria sp. NPDC052558]|uniref:hypothetical protein n=1 Tax=Kutzneria sp. NPDC052558 TaxID=3364121 RepID=UPI0037C9E4C3